MKKSLVLILAAAMMTGGDASARQAGPADGGGYRLSNGWTVKPAGTQVPLDSLPISAVPSRNGKYLLVLNCGYNPPSISVIDLAAAKEAARFKLPDAFLGLAVSPREDKVYVGGGSTGKVFELALDPDTGALTLLREFVAAQGNSMIGDVAVTRDAHLLYAADLYGSQITVINLQSGQAIGNFKTGKRPYRLLLPPGGRHLLVSAWGEGSVYQHDATSGEVVRKIRVGAHPTDMVWLNRAVANDEGEASTYIARLFVTAANTNNAYSFGASTDGQLTLLETINLSLTPMQPLGMTPSALALDSKGSRLYAVCSDGNAVAQIDVTGRRSLVLGFIPSGHYPTSVRVLENDQLAIVNGKGTDQAGGSVSLLPVPDEAGLRELTGTVRSNSPYRDDMLDGPPDSEQTAYFQRTPNHPSPIEHVIYVISSGSQASGASTTPNLQRLAKEYVRYDNFSGNGVGVAEGYNWASAAIAPDYTVKLAPSESAHRSKVYDFEGGEPANTPPAGYLWNNAVQAGLTVKEYGERIKNVGDRARDVVRDWKEFDAAGNAPALSIVRLNSAQPDNDYAAGLLVDTVSHSKLWASTAIFIVHVGEQDSRNSKDAAVWVASPYIKRGAADSGMYNQTSVLRTLELLLGLRPMTQFDAAARPMFDSFSRTPDLTPFSVTAR